MKKIIFVFVMAFSSNFAFASNNPVHSEILPILQPTVQLTSGVEVTNNTQQSDTYCCATGGGFWACAQTCADARLLWLVTACFDFDLDPACERAGLKI